jgi:hypothetical protein
LLKTLSDLNITGQQRPGLWHMGRAPPVDATSTIASDLWHARLTVNQELFGLEFEPNGENVKSKDTVNLYQSEDPIIGSSFLFRETMVSAA